jgi:excisionase family DNA binding protein
MSMPNGIKQGEPKPLSLRKAAIYLGTSPGTLSKIAERGEISYTRIGHKFGFSMLDLDLYRAEHTVEKVAP